MNKIASLMETFPKSIKIGILKYAQSLENKDSNIEKKAFGNLANAGIGAGVGALGGGLAQYLMGDESSPEDIALASLLGGVGGGGLGAASNDIYDKLNIAKLLEKFRENSQEQPTVPPTNA